jgi:hypothetical protein
MAMRSLSLLSEFFRFDQRVPVLYPEVAEHWPDLSGLVFLPADDSAFGGKVGFVTMDKCCLGAFGFPGLAGRGGHEPFGVLGLDWDILDCRRGRARRGQDAFGEPLPDGGGFGVQGV